MRPTILNNNTTATTTGKQKQIKPITTKEERVKVVVRIRPLNSRELSSNKIWKVNKENNTIHQTTVDGMHQDGVHDVYEYAHTFDTESNTKEVYESVGKPIVSAVLNNGEDGTICAYGQTASGKTYTMQGLGVTSSSSGIEQQDGGGIIQMTANDIFTHINAHSTTQKFVVRVSYIEIYNEEVRDLLSTEPGDAKRNIREKDGIFFVEHSIDRVVYSMTELLEVVSYGEKNRSVGSTQMNERSSRSHSILRITVERRTPSSSSVPTISTLNLVDCEYGAGSMKSSMYQKSHTHLSPLLHYSGWIRECKKHWGYGRSSKRGW